MSVNCGMSGDLGIYAASYHRFRDEAVNCKVANNAAAWGCLAWLRPSAQNPLADSWLRQSQNLP